MHADVDAETDGKEAGQGDGGDGMRPGSAQPVRKVVPHAGQPTRRVHAAHVLTDAGDGSEAKCHRTLRFRLGRPDGSILLGAPGEVKRQFLVDVRLEPAAAATAPPRPRRRDRGPQPVRGRHDGQAITRLTPALRRSHCAAS